MDDSNILALLPGDSVGQATQTLPDPATAMQPRLDTTIHVPDFGLVRFTCKRMCHQRGKMRHWFWTAEKAVAVE